MWVIFVGLKRNPKYSEMKRHVKKWTDTIYKVMSAYKSGLNGQVGYKLEGLNKRFFQN